MGVGNGVHLVASRNAAAYARRRTPGHEQGATRPHDRVLRLQAAAGNAAVGRLVHVTVQRMSEAQARQDLDPGRSVAALDSGFVAKHGQGVVTNSGAALVHSKRADFAATPVNTVIRDSSALVAGIKAATFTAAGDAWSVETKSPIGIVATRTRHAAAYGPAPVLTPVGTLEPDDVTVERGSVTKVRGVDEEELEEARADAGAYPRAKDANKRRAYRNKLADALDKVRARAHGDALAGWLTSTFFSINDVPIAGKRLDEIESIPTLARHVTVDVSQKTGRVFHLRGTRT